MIISLATLAMGIIIGYLGQRSGFCSTGSIRNVLITKDVHLLRDAAAFTAAALAGFLIIGLAGFAPGFPAFARAENGASVYAACLDPYGEQTGNADVMVLLTIVGGFGVGMFSILADGCPFRQHVRASEGDMGSLAFILGFYLAAIAFGFMI